MLTRDGELIMVISGGVERETVWVPVTVDPYDGAATELVECDPETAWQWDARRWEPAR